ncbi:MAG TPA: heat shock protein HspQ [Thioploca sp.]|nr:heat shock protein HspQ [Thioploca sp.]
MTYDVLFSIGQLVNHKLFHYRGVIIDVDPQFMLSEQWYEMVAKSRPPKDQPWYRVLRHNVPHQTYVAQRHLEPDLSEEPINHPEINLYFADLSDGKYISARKFN